MLCGWWVLKSVWINHTHFFVWILVHYEAGPVFFFTSWQDISQWISTSLNLFFHFWISFIVFCVKYCSWHRIWLSDSLNILNYFHSLFVWIIYLFTNPPPTPLLGCESFWKLSHSINIQSDFWICTNWISASIWLSDSFNLIPEIPESVPWLGLFLVNPCLDNSSEASPILNFFLLTNMKHGVFAFLFFQRFLNHYSPFLYSVWLVTEYGPYLIGYLRVFRFSDLVWF